MPDFEFDLLRLGWIPDRVEQIAERVKHAFEKRVAVSELQLFGYDHVGKLRIMSDEDLETFVKTDGTETGATADDMKIIKLRLPEGILSSNFRPGEAPILVKGRFTTEFVGSAKVEGQPVEMSLMLFDCGHFQLRQSLDYWVTYEGRWTQCARGYRLVSHLTYAQQDHISWESSFVIEAVPAAHESNLNFSTDGDQRLRGFLPAMVGNDGSCWVALCRRDPEPEPAEEEEEEEQHLHNGDVALPPVRPMKEELVQSLIRELTTAQQQELRTALGAESLSVESVNKLSPQVRQALVRLQRRAEVATTRREGDDGEPTWPMYLGIMLFLFVFAVFAYIWVEEYLESMKPPPEDQDQFWMKDEF